MFYLTTHSTHFIYGYMVTTQIAREETRCRHMGYSFRLIARVLLYASSHRQDDTYHGLCYTSRGALAGTRNSSMGPPRTTIHRTMSEHSYHGATSRSKNKRSHTKTAVLWLKRTVLLYIAQQWGTNTACSIHDWQTKLINSHVFPFGATRECMSWAGKNGRAMI